MRRDMFERIFYRILSYLPFVSRYAARRFHNYLVKCEVIVPTAEGAKYIVHQMDGNIRYVAENLYARNYDIVYDAKPPVLYSLK